MARVRNLFNIFVVILFVTKLTIFTKSAAMKRVLLILAFVLSFIFKGGDVVSDGQSPSFLRNGTLREYFLLYLRAKIERNVCKRYNYHPDVDSVQHLHDICLVWSSQASGDEDF